MSNRIARTFNTDLRDYNFTDWRDSDGNGIQPMADEPGQNYVDQATVARLKGHHDLADQLMELAAQAGYR